MRDEQKGERRGNSKNMKVDAHTEAFKIAKGDNYLFSTGLAVVYLVCTVHECTLLEVCESDRSVL